MTFCCTSFRASAMLSVEVICISLASHVASHRSANISSTCVCCCIFNTHATCSLFAKTIWRAVAVEMVEAETDDFPAKTIMVPKNQHGQLCVDSIKEHLAGIGQILVSIGNGYPACKDGWTLNNYSVIPMQLHVASKPGRCSTAKCSSHDVCRELINHLVDDRHDVLCSARPCSWYNKTNT